ncbi:hypothetical protein [Kitasatospora sp. GP82]|uniref:hypothetical protein n=1 Tax=Kitasatospora sp. GP82 TaxID=3035089 RepID=UPI00247382E7|nr:hypothetical protein [Kitasatospora sp. GP82]MDH6129928.1 hypothetical protein [Kitasatospora sp. GP82]
MWVVAHHTADGERVISTISHEREFADAARDDYVKVGLLPDSAFVEFDGTIDSQAWLSGSDNR